VEVMMSDFVTMWNNGQVRLQEAKLRAIAGAFSPKDRRALPAALKLVAFGALCALPALAIAASNGSFEDPVRYAVSSHAAVVPNVAAPEPTDEPTVVVPVTVTVEEPKARKTPRKARKDQPCQIRPVGDSWVRVCDQTRRTPTVAKPAHLADLPWN
jgi:hypothetical protein